MKKPMHKQKTRLRIAPTQRLMPSWKQNIALNKPAVVVMTPADRSNSPPIIKMPTATATMPIVEDWYKTVKNEGNDRNEGATMRKKMKMTMAATSAPISGRASRRLDRPSWTRFDDSAGAAGGGALVVWLMVCSVG